MKKRITVRLIYNAIAITLILSLVVVALFTFHAADVIQSMLPRDLVVNVEESIQTAHTIKVDKQLEKNFALSQSRRPPIVEDAPTGQQLDYKTLFEVVSGWNPDDPDEPNDFTETLQHFNFGDEKEREIALQYRQREIPFKLYNVTGFIDTAHKWSDEYLLKVMPSNYFRTVIERSATNHFMYWTRKGLRRNTPFKEPTKHVEMSFAQWLALARAADDQRISNSTSHFYLQTNADAHERGRTFVSRDLPLFSTEEDNFFVHKVAANKGIQCRFGMRGIIAEAHYDSGRNMVAMLRGKKRYILNPPWACDKLAIISDNSHPSYRHSVIDWSDIQQAKSRGFDQVPAIETIVRMGEVLYIPSFWFHYIVSMEYSIQCNSRSGFPDAKIGKQHINSCFRKKLRNH